MKKNFILKIKIVLNPYIRRLYALILMIVTALLLMVYKNKAVDNLLDQNAWKTWNGDGSYGQISIYFNHSLSITPSSIKEYNYKIFEALKTDALVDEDDELIYCYSAPGLVSLVHDSKTVSVKAMGVGGRFFYIHPLQLINGSFFDPEADTKDQIVIDEDTAWNLFGSNDIIGQVVYINSIPHYICGVIRRQSGKIASAAGLSKPIIYLSYQTLVLNGTVDLSSYDSSQIIMIETGDEYIVSSGGSSSDSSSSDSSSSDNTTSNSSTSVSASSDSNTSNSNTSNNSTSDGSTSVNSSSESGSSNSSTSNLDSASKSIATTVSGAETTDNTNTTSSSSKSSSTTTYSSSSSYTESLSYGERADNEGVNIVSGNVDSIAGIACYELVMPDAVENYASSLIKDKLGFTDNSDIVVMDSRTRFSFGSLLTVLKAFPSRSMQLTEFSYPYWENIARGWEDILAIVVFAELILYIIAFILLVWIVVSWYNNKTWKTRDIIRKINDKIYDYQSHRRGKSNGKIQKNG